MRQRDVVNLRTYRIAQNSGGEKLWRQIRDVKVLARKTLANERHLYHWQEKTFDESEGESSFVNSLNSLCLMMH